MLVGCLAGCSTAAASQGGTSQLGTASPPMTEESEQTKEQNVVCPDLLIAVDVSGLETREQKPMSKRLSRLAAGFTTEPMRPGLTV